MEKIEFEGLTEAYKDYAERIKSATERITALNDKDNIKIRKLLSKTSRKVTADTVTYFILSTPLTREVFSGFYSVRRIK